MSFRLGDVLHSITEAEFGHETVLHGDHDNAEKPGSAAKQDRRGVSEFIEIGCAKVNKCESEQVRKSNRAT